jgi:hypothetical protein
MQLEAPTHLRIPVDPTIWRQYGHAQRSKPWSRPSSSMRVPHLSQTSRQRGGDTLTGGLHTGAHCRLLPARTPAPWA